MPDARMYNAYNCKALEDCRCRAASKNQEFAFVVESGADHAHDLINFKHGLRKSTLPCPARCGRGVAAHVMYKMGPFFRSKHTVLGYLSDLHDFTPALLRLRLLRRYAKLNFLIRHRRKLGINYNQLGDIIRRLFNECRTLTAAYWSIPDAVRAAAGPRGTGVSVAATTQEPATAPADAAEAQLFA